MNITTNLVVTATFNIITSGPETLVLENEIVDPYEESCFSNTHKIITAGNGTVFITLPGSTASLIAGERIIMLPGTHLQAGSQVHAYIAPNGPFCEEPDKQIMAVDIETGTFPVDTSFFVNDNNTIRFKVFPNPTNDRW